MANAWPDPAMAAATRGRRRRVRRRASSLLVVAVAILVVEWLGLLDGRGEALVAGVLVAFAFMRLLIEREAAGMRGPYSQAMVVAAQPSPPSNRLTELERTLDLATTSAADAHHVLRPLVVDIAGTWLEATHGCGLDDPRAAAALPPAVWALASPTARRPHDLRQRGPTPTELDGLIAQLEALR